jgi:hypothetical protein
MNRSAFLVAILVITNTKCTELNERNLEEICEIVSNSSINCQNRQIDSIKPGTFSNYSNMKY